MDKLNIEKIKKEDFLMIKEDDVLFITNPGRMGDEDSMTFVVKQDNIFRIYRVNGWMYSKNDGKDYISLDDAFNQFPKWHDTWQNSNDKNYQGKYQYLYMGFGNGLSVDNRVYKDFKPYLDKEVNEYLKKYSEEKQSLQYVAIFNVWKTALMKMINKDE